MENIVICTRLFASSFLVEDSLGEIKIVISPPIIDVLLAQGTVYFFSISLTNLSDVDLRVSANVFPFTFDENGTLVLLEEPDKWSCVDWVELDTQRFVAIAKRSFILTGKVSIPQNVTGGRHCAVTFDIDSSSLTEGIGVKIKTGTLIFISISSTEKKELVIESFSLEKSDQESVIFSTIIRNLGNTYLKIDGGIDIRDSKGKKVKTIPLKDVITILPEKRRIIRSVWKHPKIEDFTAHLYIRYDGVRTIEKKLTGKVGYEI